MDPGWRASSRHRRSAPPVGRCRGAVLRRPRRPRGRARPRRRGADRLLQPPARRWLPLRRRRGPGRHRWTNAHGLRVLALADRRGDRVDCRGAWRRAGRSCAGHHRGRRGVGGRSEDTDGNPDTPRAELDPVQSWGTSGEVAWMVTGQHRRPGACPVAGEKIGVEVAGGGERLSLGGGASGGELAVRVWHPIALGGGVSGGWFLYDTVPLEEPEATSSWHVAARVTARWLWRGDGRRGAGRRSGPARACADLVIASLQAVPSPLTTSGPRAPPHDTSPRTAASATSPSPPGARRRRCRRRAAPRRRARRRRPA